MERARGKVKISGENEIEESYEDARERKLMNRTRRTERKKGCKVDVENYIVER